MPRKKMSKSVKKRIQRDNMWYETGTVQAGERAASISKPKIASPKMPKLKR